MKFFNIEDVRKVAPTFAKQLDDAFMEQLPFRGQVRSPNGLVHTIIGNYTACDIQWAAHSRKYERDLPVVGWKPCPDAPSCLECVVES